jgi:hypothetical protein
MRILLLTLSVLALSFAADAQLSPILSPDDAAHACSQPPTACEKPVKWLANEKDCSCYACEYGKPGRQHTICTSNKDAKAALMRFSRNDGGQLELTTGTKVLADPKSGVYYKDDGFYGDPLLGKLMTEAEAKAKGFKESPDDKDPALVKELSGKIAVKDGTATLIDGSGKTWNIVNPGLVRDYAGQAVDLNAHVDENKDQILVMYFKSPGHKD